ncbi:MAG: type II secretion system protein GspD, partial [Kiritimatiellales bacterium]
MLKLIYVGMSIGLAGFTVAEVPVTAQDYAIDSDVVLESAVREIKSIPKDTAEVVGDTLKFVSDETVTAAKGVAAAFRSSPVEKAEKAGMIETAKAWHTENDIVFRSYSIGDSVGSELTQGRTGEFVDVSDSFPCMDFPEGTSVYYRPEFKKIFVRQTMENILLIEDLLAERHNTIRELMGKQVEIETKFVEVNQSTLNELGFDWNFDRKNGGDANIFENLVFPYNQSLLSDTLRTSAQALNSGATPAALAVTKGAGSLRWSLLISALEQSDDTDVLSAPRIVTRDGNTATIQVGEERMVPKRFGVNSANTSIYVEHSDWDSELMGVQLEVT